MENLKTPSSRASMRGVLGVWRAACGRARAAVKLRERFGRAESAVSGQGGHRAGARLGEARAGTSRMPRWARAGRSAHQDEPRAKMGAFWAGRRHVACVLGVRNPPRPRFAWRGLSFGGCCVSQMRPSGKSVLWLTGRIRVRWARIGVFSQVGASARKVALLKLLPDKAIRGRRGVGELFRLVEMVTNRRNVQTLAHGFRLAAARFVSHP